MEPNKIASRNPIKWRENVGRNKIIKDPQQLWDLFEEYKTYIDSNPWKKKEIVKGGWLAGQTFDVDTQRPYTWMGFENYVFRAVGLTTLEDYKTNKEGRYKEFIEVIHVIEGEIFDQKIHGAMVGAFQHNIVAMELGLSSKVENKVVMEQPLFPPDEDQEPNKE